MSSELTNSRLGSWMEVSSAGEIAKAYVPPSLPPTPAIQMGQINGLLELANFELGQLQGMSSLLPEAEQLIGMYGRKEALLSSQIEGSRSSLSDLLVPDSRKDSGKESDDEREVSNYVKAMEYGLARMDSLPISSRFIREIHERLLSGSVRGAQASPGAFRRIQNWIGGARISAAHFVPPPPDQVDDLMSDLEKFVHGESELPKLIRIGLVHAQFEIIHPFLDGNGRVGRLLIVFLLCMQGLLKDPRLYLSLYFKTHRQQYYDHLQRIQKNGDWEGWLEFFLQGIIATSKQATEAARSILQLFDEDRQKIERLGRPARSALAVHHFLQHTPIVSIPQVSKELNLSVPTVSRSIDRLQRLGILRQRNPGQYGREFEYKDYFKILEQGTEPL